MWVWTVTLTQQQWTQRPLDAHTRTNTHFSQSLLNILSWELTLRSVWLRYLMQFQTLKELEHSLSLRVQREERTRQRISGMTTQTDFVKSLLGSSPKRTIAYQSQ